MTKIRLKFLVPLVVWVVKPFSAIEKFRAGFGVWSVLTNVPDSNGLSLSVRCHGKLRWKCLDVSWKYLVV